MKAMFNEAHRSFSSVMPPVTRFLFYAVAIGFVATNALVLAGRLLVPGLSPYIDKIYLLSPQEVVYGGGVWQLFTYPFHNGVIDLWSIIGTAFNLLILFQFGSMIESHMSSRRYAWFAFLVLFGGGVVFVAYSLIMPYFGIGYPVVYDANGCPTGYAFPKLHYSGITPFIVSLFVAALRWYPRMEISVWGVPMQMRMLVFLLAILWGLNVLKPVTTSGLGVGLAPVVPEITAIILTFLLARYGAVLDFLAGIGRGGRRRKSAKVVRMNMGHPGRHTDPDDLYDDPHWKLDQ